MVQMTVKSYLNNKMLSLGIDAGPALAGYAIFSSVIAILITRNKSSKKAFYCSYGKTRLRIAKGKRFCFNINNMFIYTTHEECKL